MVSVYFAIVFLVVAFLSMQWCRKAGRKILDKWAAANGFTLLVTSERWFRRGPFFWTASKNQVIFFVKLQTRDSRVRDAWVCCGGFWIGPFSDEVKVKWADEN